MGIVLVGLNHRTAPVELENAWRSRPRGKAGRGRTAFRGVLSETLVLSTCNRSELYGVPAESAPQSAQDSACAIELFWRRSTRSNPPPSAAASITGDDREAVRHLFRVAAGLDSMMLGEAEILGQVREAYRIALDHGVTGPVLNRMFQGALEVGKRVRSETEIGTRPMSVAFAGVKLAERIFGSLKTHKALIWARARPASRSSPSEDRGIARFVWPIARPNAPKELALAHGGGSGAWKLSIARWNGRT